MNLKNRFRDSLLGKSDSFYNSSQKNNFLYPTLLNMSKPHTYSPHLWSQAKLEYYLDKDGNKFYYKDHPDYNLFSKKEYSINRKLYRGKDFIVDEPSEVLVAGCSQTWGTGLPDNLIWPSLLQEKLKTNGIDNLAQPGKSIRGIVETIFTYFKEIGHPEKIFILLPPLWRFRLPRTPGVFVSSEEHNNDILIDGNVFSQNDSKYYKLPLILQEVITEEIAYDQSLMSLRLLEQYCKQFKIFLRYGFWEPDDNLFFSEIANKNQYYEGYTFIDSEWFNKNFFKGKHPDCHKELANDVGYRMFWEQANDYSHHKNAHIGAHASIHIAEKFYEEVVNAT
jgi:hypothetical protein